MADGTNETMVGKLENLEEGISEEGTTVENANIKGDDDKSIALTSAFDSTADSVLDGKEEEEEEVSSGCCRAWRILGLLVGIMIDAAAIPFFCWGLATYDPKCHPAGGFVGHMVVIACAGTIAIFSLRLATGLLMLDLVLRGHPFQSFHHLFCHLNSETDYGPRKWGLPASLTIFYIVIYCKYSL